MSKVLDIESLIAEKRREIEKEKALLGLQSDERNTVQIDVEETINEKKKVLKFEDEEQNYPKSKCSQDEDTKFLYKTEETIPFELERYIRAISLDLCLPRVPLGLSKIRPRISIENDGDDTRNIFEIGLELKSNKKKNIQNMAFVLSYPQRVPVSPYPYNEASTKVTPHRRRLFARVRGRGVACSVTHMRL
ncbi:hypothetical protein EVAR_25959_1 [Eumeta japonica]|uniref:Uncharacterized protein n=1 Tax=Eumeta variegata TaxID=151549 RepID=A0A4C1V245_EUMVA|nr:hypothetical protein EVAR_25959_1 [Eumeta japonica]